VICRATSASNGPLCCYDICVQYTQKYCLVSFISPADAGVSFSMLDWPLHITLADVFAVDCEGTGIVARLAKLLAEQSSVMTRATDDVVLGETNVVLVERNNHLTALHYRVVDLLEANSAQFNTPAFIREGFLPHCTIQKAGRLHNGQEALINTIALVDMFPDQNWQQRKVLNVFRLLGK
jgi:hypothetical protein